MILQPDDAPDQVPAPEVPNVPYDPFNLWMLFGPFAWVVYVAAGGLKIWMLIECVRKDPDRYLWMWIIVFVPFGSVIYLFARWLPESGVRPPQFLRRMFRGRELERLRSAALQIGNPHQYIQWGDALRETRQFQQATSAYAQALQKDPDSMQALWGAALVDMELKSYQSARDRLARILELDPNYKFGDVSLELGKALHLLGREDEAIAHLLKHVKRWPQPEALYLLASLEAKRGDQGSARVHLEALLLDLTSSPKSIARKHSAWRSRARRLLRKLGN